MYLYRNKIGDIGATAIGNALKVIPKPMKISLALEESNKHEYVNVQKHSKNIISSAETKKSVNDDIYMIGDSNTGKINADILNNTLKSKKIMVPNI